MRKRRRKKLEGWGMRFANENCGDCTMDIALLSSFATSITNLLLFVDRCRNLCRCSELIGIPLAPLSRTSALVILCSLSAGGRLGDLPKTHCECVGTYVRVHILVWYSSGRRTWLVWGRRYLVALICAEYPSSESCWAPRTFHLRYGVQWFA